MENVSVVLGAGSIEYAGPMRAAPPTEITIPLDGVLLPAVADRHVHIGMSDAGAVLLGGVTAVRDLAWPAEEIFPLADASEGPSFNGPLVMAGGPMLTAPGGYPTRAEWAPQGTGLEVRGVEEASAAVRRLAGSGAAHVKVSMNSEAGPTPADGELLAIADTAHELGLLVTAHVQGVTQAQRALAVGVDEIAHCPWTERLSDALIDAMAKRMRIVSTLHIHSNAGSSGLSVATDNLFRFVSAGGRVAYGTDLGNGAIPPGIDVAEVRLLAQAGMDNEAILESMMRSPLEVGAPADLIGVGSNPFEELEALADLRLVVRAGRIVLQR